MDINSNVYQIYFWWIHRISRFQSKRIDISIIVFDRIYCSVHICLVTDWQELFVIEYIVHIHMITDGFLTCNRTNTVPFALLYYLATEAISIYWHKYIIIQMVIDFFRCWLRKYSVELALVDFLISIIRPMCHHQTIHYITTPTVVKWGNDGIRIGLWFASAPATPLVSVYANIAYTRYVYVVILFYKTPTIMAVSSLPK